MERANMRKSEASFVASNSSLKSSQAQMNCRFSKQWCSFKNKPKACGYRNLVNRNISTKTATVDGQPCIQTSADYRSPP